MIICQIICNIVNSNYFFLKKANKMRIPLAEVKKWKKVFQRGTVKIRTGINSLAPRPYLHSLSIYAKIYKNLTIEHKTPHSCGVFLVYGRQTAKIISKNIVDRFCRSQLDVFCVVGVRGTDGLDGIAQQVGHQVDVTGFM